MTSETSSTQEPQSPAPLGVPLATGKAPPVPLPTAGVEGARGRAARFLELIRRARRSTAPRAAPPADALNRERRERSRNLFEAALSLAGSAPADAGQREAQWLLHRDGLTLCLAALARLPKDAPTDSVWNKDFEAALAENLRPVDLKALRDGFEKLSPEGLKLVAQTHEQALGALTPPMPFSERVEKRAQVIVTSVIAGLTLATLWAHHYPTGIDNPQHANLIGNMGRLIMGRGFIELEHLYRFEWFTPYAVAFAVGGLLSTVLGPLATMKVLLTIFAFGTWYGLSRWLKAIGSDPAWAVAGLPIYFGYVYIWGLLSNCFALSVVFFYLAAMERTIAAPTRRDGIICLLWGTLLFFTHGITFGMAMLVTVSRLLMNRRLKVWLLAGAHLVPLAVLTLAWIRTQPSTTSPPHGWVDKDRLTTLFSGPFYSWASMDWAKVGLALVIAALIVVRPRLNRSAGGYTAFATALLFFLALPEWAADTWLVGNRLLIFVEAFFLGLFAPWPDNPQRQLLSRSVAWSLAIGLLLLFNVRMAHFNKEVADVDTLAAKIPKDADVIPLVRWTDPVSPTFGRLVLLHVPAWVSALNGGVEFEDTSFYFQMPLRRRSAAWPQWWEYGIAHGALPDARAAASEQMGPSSYVASAGDWHLFHRSPKSFHGLLLVRALQDWETLQLDLNVSKGAMHVGGQQYTTGLGTHANSWIRVRATRNGHLTGGCGVDDAGKDLLKSAVRCVILNDAHQVKFDSGSLQGGEAPQRFDVPMTLGEELVLEATVLAPDISGAHVDWVQLQLE
jgi:hypothetical protein